jgi:hypothetical protein
MTKARFAVALLAVAGLISGCVTGQKMGGIHEGMSKREVVAILGNPDGYQRTGEYEALRYTDRLISGWSWNRTDYTVIQQNGHVSEYGRPWPGSTRGAQRPGAGSGQIGKTDA